MPPTNCRTWWYSCLVQQVFSNSHTGTSSFSFTTVDQISRFCAQSGETTFYEKNVLRERSSRPRGVQILVMIYRILRVYTRILCCMGEGSGSNPELYLDYAWSYCTYVAVLQHIAVVVAVCDTSDASCLQSRRSTWTGRWWTGRLIGRYGGFMYFLFRFDALYVAYEYVCLCCGVLRPAWPYTATACVAESRARGTAGEVRGTKYVRVQESSCVKLYRRDPRNDLAVRRIYTVLHVEEMVIRDLCRVSARTI